MTFGIQNATNTTLHNITQLANFSGDPMAFMVKANHTIYGGWFFFILLIVLGIIIYRILQDKNDQPINNLMYGFAIVSIISLFLRAIYIIEDGVFKGMLTDFQMWIFPVITAILAGIIYYIRE